MAPVDSRLPGFYRWPLGDRRREILKRADLGDDALAVLDRGGIDAADADRMVENALGVYTLPLGVGLNFRINGKDVLVPMAVEEPSVIAAASNAARLIREGGGFLAEADQPIMTTQIELVGVPDLQAARARILAHADELLAAADTALPRLRARGGGARGLEVREPALVPGFGPRLVVHVHVDVRDAMGANLVNTVAEAIAPRLAELAGGRFGLRILTNLSDRRKVRVVGRVPLAALAPGAPGDTADAAGALVASDIEAASVFAEADPYRAATHNKGIMNGVDAVVVATGNDWRGVEAGAHAFAARSGQYRPLATWRREAHALVGRLELPMAVGTAGGTLQVHAGARLALRLLGEASAQMLAQVIGCVGLASNLAALRALATEGIQRGHMRLHERAVGRPQFGPAGPAGPDAPALPVSTPPSEVTT